MLPKRPSEPSRPATAARGREAAAARWYLVGTPNVGKTSLINAVSGSRLEVGNWAGTTVEVTTAKASIDGDEFVLVDLPGAYTLASTSPEEDVVLPAIAADPHGVIVNLVDATHLARDLTLTLELTELGRPMCVALNLVEHAIASGISIDAAALESRLGVPVVTLRDHRRHGAGILVDAARQARVPEPLTTYPERITSACVRLASSSITRWHALAALGDELPIDEPAARAEREALGADGIDPFLAIAEARHLTAHGLAAAATERIHDRADPGERVDRWLLHPVAGPLALVAGLAVTFHLTFALSDPWVGLLGTIQGVLSGWIAALPLPGLVTSFLSGALIEGVGTVVAFAPVLFALYAILGFLENAGILARVAFLADGLMKALGLPGRAVLPMVLALGCTVPAVQATRGLEQRSDRLRVALALPSIPCSARLPVLVLLAAAFVPAYAAWVVTGLYLLGFGVSLASSLLFRRLLPAVPSTGTMELPSYRWPPARLVLGLAWARTRSFLKSAGGPILLAMVLVWGLLNLHLPGGASLFETVSRFLAPAFAPLGMNDWRIVGALIPGAVAKEVVLGGLALTLVGGTAVEPLAWMEGLRTLGTGVWIAVRDTLTALWGFSGREAIDTGLSARLAGVLSTGGAVALMVFTLLYMPCVATLTALRQAFGTRWMVLSAAYQTAVAYLLAWGVFALWP
ncbi:MAG: ferrous iron transport protein B [Trueperaceae bacterium]